MNDPRIMPLEKRQKVNRKAKTRAAEVLRETGAAFVYTAVFIKSADGMHMVDASAGDGAMVPHLPSLLRSLASANEAQDTHVSSGGQGDVGYTQ